MSHKAIPGGQIIETISKLFTPQQLEIVAKCVNAELTKDKNCNDLLVSSQSEISDCEYLEYIFSMASQA